MNSLVERLPEREQKLLLTSCNF